MTRNRHPETSSPGDARIALAVLFSGMFVLASVGCSSGTSPEADVARRDLDPPSNLGFREQMPEIHSSQPHRTKPRDVVVAPSRDRLYIALPGSIDHPENEVVAFDTRRREIARRFRVGRSPAGLALHPSGRYLVVTNRFSNYLSVVDLGAGEVSAHRTDFYLVDPAFSPSGDRLYAANRWRDSLQTWTARSSGGELRLERTRPPDHRHGIPVGTNPSEVRVSPDGDRVYVAAQGGLTVSVVAAANQRRIRLDRTSPEPREGFGPPDPGRHVGAPPNDLAIWKGHLYVPTTSASTHHRPFEGPDTNGDGEPGDGTPNFDFSDLQNEIAIYELPRLEPQVRYTSDTICCFDWRDVSPTPSDTFRSSPRLRRALPDRSKWIVEGALPERAAVTRVGGAPRLIVTYSGSNQVQRFRIHRDGTLEPGPVAPTEFNPMGLAVDRTRGEVYVTNRLSETLTILDLESFDVLETVVVGDVSGGEFPATDAELGEFLQFSGAAFSIDGDQTCNHCHRQQGAIGKSFHMPLLASDKGTRNMMDHRAMFGTRPWFIEGAQDETNFFPVINEFARRENFCCANVDDPNCKSDPPPACSERKPPRNLPTRDAYFLRQAREVLDRTRSFGDAVDTKLDFLGMTKVLGVFLLQNSGALPNPNPETPRTRRGRRIFNSAEAGCAGCHPPPTFAASLTNNPFGAPLHFGPVVTPNRSESGRNLDLAAESFLGTFPRAQQENGTIRLKSTSLLGIWDRPAPFLHDGRADNLREAILTPNHPALKPGETGFNELNGMPDTHGGTSHLTPEQIRALIAFMETL